MGLKRINLATACVKNNSWMDLARNAYCSSHLRMKTKGMPVPKLVTNIVMLVCCVVAMVFSVSRCGSGPSLRDYTAKFI